MIKKVKKFYHDHEVLCTCIEVLGAGLGLVIAGAIVSNSIEKHQMAKLLNSAKDARLVYDYGDAIALIMKETGMDKNSIINVLRAEEHYMVNVGIMGGSNLD